ncbi:transposable element Tcb2 transposase [Trichonephila clavipes]|nr:transposable element Tcb2 transposase [Trichonephila clavipes]
MAWPAYSPDLNPIENLWGALGRAVSSRFPPPVTLTELETALQEEWRLLNSAVAYHLVESMVRRFPCLNWGSGDRWCLHLSSTRRISSSKFVLSPCMVLKTKADNRRTSSPLPR